MTWPFENDTSAVVKKLANRSIQANRRRNIFVIVTIVLATAMFSTMCLLASGITATTLNNATNYTAAYTKIPESRVDVLAGNTQFDKVGIHCRIPERTVDGNTLNLVYMDQGAAELGNIEITGSLPENENDIVVQKEYLKKLGLSASIGDGVSLNLGDGNQEYTITGFVKSPAKSDKTFSFLCSRKFLTANTAPAQRNYTVYTFLEMARAYSDTELNELLESVFADADLPSTCGIMLNDTSISQLMIKAFNSIRENAALFGGITFLLILTSGITVYNIFMISVRNSIREYGQFRTIGATKQQIKRVVSSEGKLLMRRGIPLGLLLSCIVAYFAMQDGFRWYIALAVCAVTFLLMLAVIKISMRSPVKAAIKTSPIEALRYGYQNDEKIDRKNDATIHLSPWNLAKVNFKRNRRKNTTIIISLTLCGILFVLSSSVFSSMDTGKRARMGNELGQNDFVVFGYSPELEAAITSISGITRVENRCGSNFDWTLPNGTIIQSQGVHGFTKEEYEENILPKLGEDALPYDQLMKGNGIILYQQDYINYYSKSVPCKYGSSITLTDPKTQNAASYTVYGEYKRQDETGTWAGMPIESMLKLTQNFPIYSIGINGEKNKWEQIDAELHSLAEKFGVEYQSIVSETEADQSNTSAVTMISNIIILLLFLFAILNLSNTIITNVISRRREFGVLRAVGLSRKQLLKMLYFENGLYAGISVSISVILGGAAGYFAVKRISEYGYTYHFPLIPIFFLIAFIFSVVGIITALADRTEAKASIVEQINIIE